MNEMSDEQRRRLGNAVRQARTERYETKLAAYQAAGVNAATWDRVEKGLSVKSHTLVAVIKELWPSAGGDWRNVPGVYDMHGQSVFGGPPDEMGDRDHALKMESWVMELQERIELLERHVYRDGEVLGREHPGQADFDRAARHGVPERGIDTSGEGSQDVGGMEPA